MLTAVLWAAQRYSRQLPRPQRLQAATAILSNPPRSGDDTEKEPFWATLASTFEQAGQLLQHTTSYVRDDSQALTNTRELAEQVQQVGRALKDAGAVLREMRYAELPRDDEMLKTIRRPTPAQLRLARSRGDYRALVAELERRQGEPMQRGQDWKAVWTADGAVTAEAADGTVAAGWAACPEAVTELLAPWEPTSLHRPKITLEVADPPDVLAPWSEGALLSTEQATAAFEAGAPQLRAIEEALEQLRTQWPAHEIADRVQDAARLLQKTAPQVPFFDLVNHSPDALWAHASSAGWVRVEAIVEAGDPVWGHFDRLEKSRGPIWLPTAASELLAQPPEKVAGFLRHHLFDEPPVNLTTLAGPAGPIHGISTGGIHRTHLFKVLGLPWLYANQDALIPPRRLDVSAVIPPGSGPREAARTAALWEGLLDRGLATGRIERNGPWATMHLDRAPALWMLGTRDFAAAYNTAYERVYPGALAQLGIPDTALEDGTAWEHWLTAHSREEEG
ncbi:hypothetical protein AB0442_28530 [Kitasatospora sp. NPDC085895]|uniref:hypothetical protein n=1 Tax=Kitasatospora sp. NPDC085895 TaxID=3155057 RepID=UPI00344E1CBB